MQRIPVTSSDLSSVGYDSGSQTLEIQFNSGGIYQYFNVPSNVYEGLMSAPSHGKYFHTYIKNSYSWQKL